MTSVMGSAYDSSTHGATSGGRRAAVVNPSGLARVRASASPGNTPTVTDVVPLSARKHTDALAGPKPPAARPSRSSDDNRIPGLLVNFKRPDLARNEPGIGTGTITEEDTRTDYRVDEGDHDRFAHVVQPASAVMEAMITGVPCTALCGKRWVPSRDPKRYPVCPTCKEIVEGHGFQVPSG